MTEDNNHDSGLGPEPVPTRDADVPRAPGGPDAVPEESDVGAGGDAGGVLIPDQPLSAQQDAEEVPSSLQEGEQPSQGETTSGKDAASEEPD